MSNHTPGPWRVIGRAVYGVHPFAIAVVNPGPEAEANAQLIIVAPDLLEACRLQHELIEKLMPGIKFISVPDYTLIDRALSAGRQAVFNATGENVG
jgi:hypothetical protein